jgi:tartrate-resistant acid phosphatase type 5
MPEFHAEPYLYLPAISHKSVLVAWGACYFRVRSSGEMKLVAPGDLKHIHPPRTDTIGARSAPYGPARVEVFDSSGVKVAVARTDATNHCWVTGLQPDTAYVYRVIVNDEEWASGVRWDWSPSQNALVQGGSYDNTFRTHPNPDAPAASATFGVIGDFGVGMKKESEDRRQQQIGDALRRALEAHGIRFVLTTGDNIYAGKKFLGVPVGQTGDEDDDWFFTYFQPYRYVINRVCVYPSIGNHDAAESEDRDDREQVEDNFYVRERIAGEQAAGRASLDPGLFYRFRYGSKVEFVCIDTSKEHLFAERLFDHPKHRDFIEDSFPPAAGPMWRIPFCHHPPFSAGPRHHNTESMQSLIPLFQRAGVKAVFSGHEHNFQHSIVDGINYFVSGAAGKLRRIVPDEFDKARTRSWSSSCHFLLVDIADDVMTVRAIGELGTSPTLIDIARLDPGGVPVTEPMVIALVGYTCLHIR